VTAIWEPATLKGVFEGIFVVDHLAVRQDAEEVELH
jgi:hypothetical protein